MKSAIFDASSPSSPTSFASTPDSPSDSTSVRTVSNPSSRLARMPSVCPSASFAVQSVDTSWSNTSEVWSTSKRWFETAVASDDDAAPSCARLPFTAGIVVPNRLSE